mgnify:CR=1 FL=1
MTEREEMIKLMTKWGHLSSRDLLKKVEELDIENKKLRVIDDEKKTLIEWCSESNRLRRLPL